MRAISGNDAALLAFLWPRSGKQESAAQVLSFLWAKTVLLCGRGLWHSDSLFLTWFWMVVFGFGELLVKDCLMLAVVYFHRFILAWVLVSDGTWNNKLQRCTESGLGVSSYKWLIGNRKVQIADSCDSDIEKTVYICFYQVFIKK